MMMLMQEKATAAAAAGCWIEKTHRPATRASKARDPRHTKDKIANRTISFCAHPARTAHSRPLEHDR